MIEVGVDRTPAAIGGLALVALFTLLASCAEVEVGAEALKSLNRSSSPAPTNAETPAVDARFATAPGSPINPGLAPDPEGFETAGFAVWDGARTLQGIWVAHPKARQARRVRVINSETGRGVDGALFRRDTRIGGPPILISSEAALALDLKPNVTSKLVIVALKPGEQRQVQDASAQLATTDAASAGPSGAAEDAGFDEAGPVDAGESDRLAAAAGTAAATDALVEEITSETREETDEEATSVVDFGADSASAELQSSEVDAGAPANVDSVSPDVAAAGAETAPGDASSVDAALTAATQISATTGTESTSPDESAPAAESESPKPQLKWQEPPTEITEDVPETTDPVSDNATAATKTPAPSGDLVIKAGVFGVKENAERLVEEIKSAGFPATAETFSSGTRTLTSVVAGPFDSPEQQAAALHVIRGLGVPDAVATKG